MENYMPPPMQFDDMSYQEIARDQFGDSGIDDEIAVQSSMTATMVMKEADKIRQWQVKMEMELRHKDEVLMETHKNITELRASLYKARAELETVSTDLHNERRGRDEVHQKLDSTRQLCFLLQEETKGLKTTFKEYEDTFERFQEEDQLKKQHIDELEDLFEVLQKKIQTLEEDAETRIREIRRQYDAKETSLKNTIKQKDEEINKLSTNISNLTKELEVLSMANKNLILDIQKQEENKNLQMEKLHNEINSLQEIVCKKEEDIAAQASSYEGRLKDIKKEMESKDVSFKQQITEISCEFETEIETKITNEKSLNHQINELNKKLEDQVKLIKNQAEESGDQITGLKSEKCELEKTIRGQKDTINKLENENELFKAAVQKHEDSIDNLETANKLLKEDIKDMKKESGEKIKELESQLKDKCDEFGELTKDYKQLDKTLGENEKSSTKKQEAQDKKFENLKAEIKKLKEDLKKEKSEHNESKSLFKKEKKSLEDKVKDLNKSVDTNRTENEKNHKSAEEKIEKLENDLKEAKEKIESFNSSYVEFQALMDTRTEENIKLTKEIADLRARTEKEKMELEENLTIEKKKAEDSKKSSKSQIKKLQLEIQDAKDELKRAIEKQMRTPMIKKSDITAVLKTGEKYPGKENLHLSSTKNRSNVRLSKPKPFPKRPKVDFTTSPSQSEISFDYEPQADYFGPTHRRKTTSNPRSSTPIESKDKNPKTPTIRLRKGGSVVPKATPRSTKKDKKEKIADISWLNDSVYGFDG